MYSLSQHVGAEGQVNLSADIFYFLCVVFIASY